MPENQLIAGRYRLLSPLGEGGMGVVWRARDEVLAREVAVKEVRAPGGLGDSGKRRLYQRLEREAWAAGRISHRNVVTVFDVATEDGRPWIVMELVRGLSLADVLESEGPLAPRRAAHIGAEVLAALRAAHASGVLHRDVKPGNVLIANDGRVVLSDFGIAVVEGTSQLTMTGELIGSPEFLAPERALGRVPGPESDLWSLGVLLYAAVEGGSPFRRGTALNTLRAVVDEGPPPLRLAGDLAPVIEGLLRKEPAERIPAAEAERELRLVSAGGSARARPAPAAYSPTVAAGPVREETGPREPVTRPVPAGPPPAAEPGPPGGSRAVAVLTAGVAVLLIGLAVLFWTLLPETGKSGGGTEARGGPAPSPVTAAPVEPSAAAPAASGASTSPAGRPSTRPQTAEVSVTASRTSYTGRCPLAGADAPVFRAVIGVGRAPASAEYRWVVERGAERDASGWRTLSFGSGEPLRKPAEYTVTGYGEAGTYRDRIRVEVRSPVAARSEWVSFTVVCEEPVPTATGSSPGSPTADPPAPAVTGG
ncbi:serine/threonine-protein kinase [Streptomyces sp. CAU 1734]|uniref:serine/threonine-protein kinase n=1 Tax=Streptomyces sp. CAU 1734 TaxID=3140360 RepID=UPI003261190C